MSHSSGYSTGSPLFWCGMVLGVHLSLLRFWVWMHTCATCGDRAVALATEMGGLGHGVWVMALAMG